MLPPCSGQMSQAGRLWVWIGAIVCTAMCVSVFLPDTMAGGLRMVSPLAYAWDLLAMPREATEELAIVLAMLVCSMVYLVLGLILAGWGGCGGLGGLGFIQGVLQEMISNVKQALASCLDACTPVAHRARGRFTAQGGAVDTGHAGPSSADASAMPLIRNVQSLSPRLHHYQID
jgi:hypothetical protein